MFFLTCVIFKTFVFLFYSFNATSYIIITIINIRVIVIC